MGSLTELKESSGSLNIFEVPSSSLRFLDMYTYGMYTYGMYTYGMYTYGMYTYGMYTLVNIYFVR